MSAATDTLTPQTPIPSDQRVLPGSASMPPAPWPASAVTDPAAVDAPRIAHRVVAALNDALARADYDAVADGVFHPGNDDDDGGVSPFWRDHLVVSWALRTLRGRDGIRAFLRAAGERRARSLRFAVDESSAFRRPQVAELRPRGGVRGVVFFVTVESAVGAGRGVARLVEVAPGQWRIWTLFTTLEALAGFEERRGPRREAGVLHGELAGRKTWVERRREEADFVHGGPEVLIIGEVLALGLAEAAGVADCRPLF